MNFFQQDYGYTIGLVRALEVQLLNTGHVERMIDAENADAAYKVLNDTDFAEYLAEISSVKDFEILLEKSLLATKKQLTFVSPSADTLRGAWLWYDYYNIKTALKASLTKKSFEDIENTLSPYGSISYLKVRDFAFHDLSLEGFSSLRQRAVEAYERHKDVQYVDFIFDKAMLEKLSAWAKEMGSDVLLAFTKKKIDIINAQVYLRLGEEAVSKELFAQGGNIATSFFQGGKDELVTMFANILHSDEGVKESQEKQVYWKLVKEGDDLLTRFIQQVRYLASGPEPLIAYWWAREKSAEVIRIILAGKMNDISGEFIRQQVKTLY